MITPDLHPFSFIQKLASDPKQKLRVKLQDIITILRHQHLLKNIHERGQFSQIMAELIYHQFNFLGVRVKGIHNEVCKIYKAPRKREGRNEAPRRQRKHRVAGSQQFDLDRIAQEAIDNPAHLQDKRRAQDKSSKDDSKGSKPSNPVSNHNIDFGAQLQNLGPVDIDPMDIDHDLIHPDSSHQTSSSDSSKQNSNAISNLPEKLRILGEVSFSIDKKTVPKRRGAGVAGKTVKRRDAVIDVSTSLDQSRTIDPRQLPEPFIRQKCRALDTKKQEEVFDNLVGRIALDVKAHVFAPEALQRFKNFQNRKKKGIDYQGHIDTQFDYDSGNTMFAQDFMAPSTTFVSANPEESAFNKVLQEELDSTFLQGERRVTLTALRQKTKKPKEDIFMRLLWAAQRGDCILSQPHPEQFGEITMTVL